MDFELTVEQREIQSLAREFALAEIQPNAAAWDRAHAFPRELLAGLADVGLLGVCVPEEHGGAGADFLSYILVVEELSRADAGVGVTIAVHTSACSLPVLDFGTEDQRAQFVPPLARGEKIGAIALTESGAGSDAGALISRAERSDGGWRISGAKQWITNGSFAGTFLFFARTDPAQAGPRGVSAFVLDAEHVAGHARGGEARAELVVHRGSRDRRGGAGGPAARRGERRLSDRDGDARRRPDRDRRAGRRHRPGRVRRRARATRSSGARSDSRSRASRRSSTSSRTCRPRSTLRGCWSIAPRGRSNAGFRTRPRGRRRSSSRRRWRDARRRRRSRSLAATATRRSSPWSGTTATRRSPRSTRARARSSGS